MTTGNGQAEGLRQTFRVDPSPLERIIANVSREIVDNAITFRRDLANQLLDRRRNYERECGHPDLSVGWDVVKLQQLYDRDPIAGAVVDRLPELCWQVQPTVYETEDPEEVTPFEEDVDALATSLRGEQSWYAEEAGSPLWDYLERLDKLSRVGSYGILVLGLDDGLPLSAPVKGWQEDGSVQAGKTVGGDVYVPPPNYSGGVYNLTVNADQTRGRKLLYLRAFSEPHAPVLRWENNRNSPRFGQPTAYQLQLFDPTADRSTSNPLSAPVGSTQEVHWSRVIHLADTATGKASGSDWFATPAMWPVYERIMDCRKLYAGSAEMYWLGALPGLVVKTQPRPELVGSVDINKTDTKDQIENYMHGLKRFLLLNELDANTLSPTVVDPSAQIDAQLTAIAIRISMPKRVLMGSEQGVLAADQDSKGMVPKVRKRRNGHLTANLIVRLFNRFIGAGVVRPPSVKKKSADGREKVGFCVSWPEEESQTPGEKAAVSLQKTQALGQYVQTGAESLVPPLEFLTGVMGYPDEEARAVLDAAAAEADQGTEVDTSIMDQPAGLTAVVGLYDAAAKGSLTEDQLKAVLDELFGPDRADELLAGGLPEPPAPPPAAPGPPQTLPGVPGQPNPQPKSPAPFSANSFCATGEGGGVDPSCSPGGKGHLAAPELVQAARAMTRAFPFPSGGAPATPPGTANPDMVAKSPELQAAVRRQQQYAEQYNRAFAAHAVERHLTGAEKLPPPPEPGLSEGRVKQRVKRAIDARQAAEADLLRLDPAGPFGRHLADVTAGVPSASAAAAEAYRAARRLHAEATNREGEYRAVVAQIRAKKGTTHNAAADDFSDLASGPVTPEGLFGVLAAVRESFGGDGLAAFVDYVSNVFCPTGEGGGVDPSCSPGENAGILGKDYVPEFSNQPYYHGSREPIDKFHVPAQGLSFSDNEHHSREFGDHVQEVRLSVKKPLDLTHLGPGAGEEGDGVDERVSPAQIKAALAEHGVNVTFKRKAPGWTTEVLAEKMPDIIRQAAAKGYDAVLVKDFKEFEADETVIFDPRQIKVVGRR